MATTAPATKKSSKGRKSAAIALAVVGVAGLSLASAAQLNINDSSLGAGNSIVTSCQPTGTGTTAITVAFAPTLGTSDYNATQVTLGAISNGCVGYSYKVRATGAAGALGVEATGSGTTGITGTSLVVSLAGVKAEDVTGISVVIYK